LPTRDIEEALEGATVDRLLSRTAVSEVTEVLWEEYEAFSQRDLSGFEVDYLFPDAVYESVRRQSGGKRSALCAWAIWADGAKVMPHMALGDKESHANWLDFLRDVARRGLSAPVLVTMEGSSGLIRAVAEVFPRSLRQRGLAHKVRNVTDKVPDRARHEVKAAVQAAYYAPNREIADMIAAETLNSYQSLYPSVMKSF